MINPLIGFARAGEIAGSYFFLECTRKYAFCFVQPLPWYLKEIYPNLDYDTGELWDVTKDDVPRLLADYQIEECPADLFDMVAELVFGGSAPLLRRLSLRSRYKSPRAIKLRTDRALNRYLQMLPEPPHIRDLTLHTLQAMAEDNGGYLALLNRGGALQPSDAYQPAQKRIESTSWPLIRDALQKDVYSDEDPPPSMAKSQLELLGANDPPAHIVVSKLYLSTKTLAVLPSDSVVTNMPQPADPWWEFREVSQ